MAPAAARADRARLMHDRRESDERHARGEASARPSRGSRCCRRRSSSSSRRCPCCRRRSRRARSTGRDPSGVVDFVVDRVNGFFYEPNSESSLADVLRAIAGGRVDRGAVGHAARLTADRFSPAVVSEKLRESYRLVLK